MTRTGDKFLTVKDWFADKVAEELSRKIDMCDVFAILKETDKAVYAMLNVGVYLKKQCGFRSLFLLKKTRQNTAITE